MENQIIYKNIIAQVNDSRIVEMRIFNPLITTSAKAGQFIIFMIEESGERIPLTIVNKDIAKGEITIIFQELGYSTKKLGQLNIGDKLYSLVGPLGHPSPIKNYGKVLVIGGGVGIAEILPIVSQLKKAGSIVEVILGARTKELIILQEDISHYADKLYITTDDGSKGEKGFVTDVLNKILVNNKDFSLVYCVGPVFMMKSVSQITKQYNIKTIVCLNAIMLDGTGMCGSCRLTEDGKTKFCCVDGPEFDGHKVDFDELALRQKQYLGQEKSILEKFKK